MILFNIKLPLPQGEGRGEGKNKIPSPLTGEGEGGGVKFSPEQLAWLNKIKDDVQGSANVVGGRTPGTTKSPKMLK